MRLVGQYTFESLRKAIQGVFGFYKQNDDYILEVFSMRVVITPNASISLYIRNDRDYTKIGAIGFYKKDSDYVLELFSLRIVITPNVCVVLYIRNDQDYIKIGTFELH